ncbi:SLATT domain-containing protein [Desulfocurvibacter africanus]|uniref:SMODS and SLOG-associating 2TM effector domain-containing protein n=1 Tax=Desulfocurvibacter africanus subsp. africanus str. Walvis Bay TaxID=690850 RepID=F3YVK6_DESAF|nr:SLATT domain-containing protein [Desulfocurvibacter africanus]EGJ48742.1 hypothetical protein Desaf_0386 [Desulfocurvibacter africanus subsp. africanus str. Walvis Bay]
MRNKLEALSNRVWRTEKARFTAAERSRKKHQALVFAISFLSIVQVLVAISVLCGFYFPLIGTNKAEYMTLIASIIVLVIANQDSLSKLLNQSDSYHRCANKLHRLQQEIQNELANETIEKEQLHRYTKRYSEILEFHDLNHIIGDYKKMMSEYPYDFPMSWLERTRHQMRHIWNIYWLPIIYCITPFIIVLVAQRIIPN